MNQFTPGFVGGTLDRADHVRTNAELSAEAFNHPDARLLTLNDLVPVEAGDGGLATELLGPYAQQEDHVLLGIQADGTPVFAQLVSELPRGNPRFLFGLIERLDPDAAALYGTARSLNNWHARHRFCANCGAPTRVRKAGWARLCEACKAEHFPRVDPVTIFLAQHEGRVLIGRQPQMPQQFYSALAGFVEPGESLEEAVSRELKEEAGVTATSVRYVCSQPWPFPSSLMIGCFATVDDPALTIDTTELADAQWVDADQVRAALAGEADALFMAPPPLAIAHTLFQAWLAER